MKKSFTIETVKNNPKNYLSYYCINLSLLSRYELDAVKFEENNITAIHLFEPEVSHSTVLLIHGYFDHTGSLHNMINFLLRLGKRVICYDLQGHGLSSGKRGEILDFEDYVLTFKKVLVKLEEKDLLPTEVVAHSTGAAILSDYLLRTNNATFKKVIFLAPLVRASNWKMIVAGSKLLPLFISKLNRKYRKNTCDEAYLQFVKNEDPLQCRFISIPWVLALIKWNNKIEGYSPSHVSLYIIQGTLDSTVDWKYNLPFLLETFPNSTAVIIDGARHQIMNEGEVVKKILYTLLAKALL